jgi:hypothetical protein
MKRRLQARLAVPPAPGGFSDREIDGLPDPARKYLRASIAIGMPLAQSARFRMHGSIKLGGRWLRFSASQVEAPHHGFLWTARAGGLIFGSDQYVEGGGVMDWRVLGLFRVAHEEGREVSRSAAGRAGAEGIWVPTALLPRFGVTWSASDPHHVAATYRVDDTEVDLRLTIGKDGRLRSVASERWGDPDSSGTWGPHPFGFEVTGYSTFDGISIPSAGRAGWFYGTSRWGEGEFFRSEITAYSLVA